MKGFLPRATVAAVVLLCAWGLGYRTGCRQIAASDKVEPLANAGGLEVEIEVPAPEADQVKSEYLPPIRGRFVVSSPFGMRRSPFTGRQALHYGVDLVGEPGAQIVAVAGGVVITHYPPPDGYWKGHPVYGGYIEILHEGGLSCYAHLSGSFVHEGMQVAAGQVIGIQGNTGRSNGEHLHFEFRPDPARLLAIGESL